MTPTGAPVQTGNTGALRTRMPLAAALCTTMLVAGPAQAACPPGRLQLVVLGSGGPEIGDGRASSGYLLELDGVGRLLVDAGPGSAYRFERAGGRLQDLDAVLLTHLHVDHSADLAAYVKAGFFSERTRDMPLFGPSAAPGWPSLSAWLQAEFAAPGAPYAYLRGEVTPGSPGWTWRPEDLPATLGERSERTAGPFRVTAMGVPHGPLPALAWRVEAAGCSVVFTGDTSDAGNLLADLTRDADLLVADHALSEDASDAVALRLHMRPSQIAHIAGDADARALLLSHRMLHSLGHEAQSTQVIRRDYTGPLRFAEDGEVIWIGAAPAAR